MTNKTLKAWMNPALLEEMEEGVLNAPQDLLGMHYYDGIQLFIVRRPKAQRIWITNVAVSYTHLTLPTKLEV